MELTLGPTLTEVPGNEVTPNPSIERTATGKPVSAAHVER